MIFDTNIHVTVDEKWDNKIKKNKFKDIIDNYKKNKLKGFCAVGINNLGSYNHSKFINIIKKYKFIHPVAGFNLQNNIENEFEEVSKLGFKSIKIHPRASNLTLSEIYNIIPKYKQTKNGCKQFKKRFFKDGTDKAILKILFNN